VGAENWFTKMAKIVEAMIAEFQAKLVFTLGVETATALVTSGKFRTFADDLGGNFWINFLSNHDNSQSVKQHVCCQFLGCRVIECERLRFLSAGVSG
jgi:hypothetical protein